MAGFDFAQGLNIEHEQRFRASIVEKLQEILSKLESLEKQVLELKKKSKE
jgi:hypothetical protein